MKLRRTRSNRQSHLRQVGLDECIEKDPLVRFCTLTGINEEFVQRAAISGHEEFNDSAARKQ
jgi:hypothetical protein